MSEQASQIRIAVLGAGAWGKNHVRVAHEAGALVAVADPREEIRAQIQSQYPDVLVTADAGEAMDAADAVVIATPAITHHELTLAAIAKGKDVFVEKPIAVTSQEAREMHAAALEHGRILMVGHILLYHPAVEELLRRCRAEDFGEVRYAYSNRLNLGRVRQEENVLWSFAPHDLAVLLTLFGAAPTKVSCNGQGFINRQVADVSLTALRFGNALAHVFVSWLHPYKDHKMVIVGEREMLVFNDGEPWETKLMSYPHQVEIPPEGPPILNRADGHPIPLPESEPLRAEVDHFISCCTNRSQPRTDGAQAIAVMDILEAAGQSMNEDSA